MPWVWMMELALNESGGGGDCGPFFVERDMVCILTLMRYTLGPQVVPHFGLLSSSTAARYDAIRRLLRL